MSQPDGPREAMQPDPAEIDRLTTQLSNQRRLIVELEARAGAQLTRFAAHRAEIAAARQIAEANERALIAALASAKAALADTVAQMDALRHSTSWRLTAPLRAVRGGVADAPAAAPPVPPPSLLPVPWPAVEGSNGHPGGVSDAELIRATTLFDEAAYAGREDAYAQGLDPVCHYLQTGEARDLAPSEAFDPAFYRARYPDVNTNLLAHYIRSGRAEGRFGRAAADTLDYPKGAIQGGRETVLVILPGADRSGLLGWNIAMELHTRCNVVVLLQNGGTLEPAIQDAAAAVIRLPDGFVPVSAETDRLAAALKRHYDPVYAVADGAQSWRYIVALEHTGIPTVALIDAVPGSVGPPGILHRLFGAASRVVFSSRILADAWLADDAGLSARSSEILLPGVCRQPPAGGDAVACLPSSVGDALLVVGLGTITLLKGVEFFIQAAACVQRRAPNHPVRFAWAGEPGPGDEAYQTACRQQITRSGLGGILEFLGEIQNPGPLLDRADLYLLSSRSDALPDTAVAAVARGKPVICFDRASSMAEFLMAGPQTRELVVPYLDSDAAAQLIAALADDPGRLSRLSAAVRDIAGQHFDMPGYVSKLDQLGRSTRSTSLQQTHDAAVIAESGYFNAGLYCEPGNPVASPQDALHHYLHTSRLVSPRARPHTGQLLRRPVEGFNPCTYTAENTGYDEAAGEDPLAHYVRTDRPAGPWAHRLIGDGVGSDGAGHTLRIALHGHFHYPELLPDFLQRLRENATGVDLLLTTTSAAKAEAIEQIVSAFSVNRVTIGVHPNRGRDLGALLTGLGPRTLGGYDLVGHLHGKISPHAGRGVGEQWRHFLWENLVGGQSSMLDRIVHTFATEPGLGLVFPEDPHLNAWDGNRPLSEALADRMGWQQALPAHFDFPVGSSFWARPQALSALFGLGLGWDDYPEEPIAVDGTILHALERLIPFAASQAGFEYRTTCVDGYTW